MELLPEEDDEFLDETISKGTDTSSQDSNLQREEGIENEQYTITEVPAEYQEDGSEVQFRGKAKEDDDRQAQMMRDIGDFFNDSSKLDRVWNLVKAIKASDQIEEQKKSRELEGDSSKKSAAAIQGFEGNRSNIDATKLITRERSETTIYTTPHQSLNSSDEIPQSNEISPELTSSDEAISPIEFSEPSRERGVGMKSLPLPPPLLPKGDQPGTSTGGWTGSGSERVRRTKQKTRDEVEEADKLNPAKPPGKEITLFSNTNSQKVLSELLRKGSDMSMIADSLSALTTEAEFDPLEVQLDGMTLQKIQQGAYVDLRKLLPRDSIGDDAEDDDLHWVLQDGTPKLKRKGSTELLAINGYRRWMTAFTAYSRIYAKEHPDRAAELHQYILDIQDASNTYTWDSVYKYDKIFRMYMEKKPWHDWGTPYTKYWNKTLKKRDCDTFSPRGHGFNGNRQFKKVCWKFNKFGKCDRGRDCEFEHKCGVCGKFGHHKGACYFNRENREVKDGKESESDRSGGYKKGRKSQA